MAKGAPQYFVLDSAHENMMLLYEPPDPSFDDSWFFGRPFASPPTERIEAGIKPGHERGTLLDYFGTACLMSNRFVETLREAGVDNLETYEAVIRSGDGTIEHKGYQAFNLIGLVRAADLEKSQFSAEVPSRLIDASISSLEIDPAKAHGLLMFRLAEYVGAVVVHERVKQAIEAKGFPNIVFREPGSFVS